MSKNSLKAPAGSPSGPVFAVRWAGARRDLRALSQLVCVGALTLIVAWAPLTPAWAAPSAPQANSAATTPRKPSLVNRLLGRAKKALAPKPSAAKQLSSDAATPANQKHASAAKKHASGSSAAGSGSSSAAGTGAHRSSQTAAASGPIAILPDGTQVAPDSHYGGYHGTCKVKPTDALRQGLPARGNNWRLLEHVEQKGDSAFRGTTDVVSDPITGGGAAYWAAKGGWVYEIRGVPSWNVNRLLEGRVQLPNGRFRGNIMEGEREIAVPAHVPAKNIKAYGQVEEDHLGRLRVKEWIPNPAFEGAP